MQSNTATTYRIRHHQQTKKKSKAAEEPTSWTISFNFQPSDSSKGLKKERLWKGLFLGAMNIIRL
jgi:hypothetical protein